MALGLGLGLSGGGRRGGAVGASPTGSQSSPGAGTIPGGTIVDDGGFTTPPVVDETVSGNIQFAGKKNSGSSAKFIYNVGLPTAGTVYTLRYDPDFSLLANSGRTAFVGFGVKRGNDFRLTGLKGDGGSGLKAFEIAGDNLWNKTSGFTLTDGGAAAHGTQAGPNYLQIETAADNATYTLRTSADGVTWTDEFTDVVASPIGDLDNATQFGIAVFLDSNDSGPFTVDVTLWTEATGTIPFQGGALVYKSADETANFNHTTITFDSESFDTDAFHDVSANTQRFTVPASMNGKYAVLRATFAVTALAAGQHLGARFQKDGADFIGSAASLLRSSDITTGSVNIESPEILLATGEIYTAVLFSSDTSTTLGADSNSFSIEITG